MNVSVIFKSNISLFFGGLLLLCHVASLPFIAWGLMLLGMITFGMPHGALDHMLGAKDFRSSFKPLFIAKYLLLMMAMWVVWLLSPAFGFTAFVAYSAWHFGESDFQEIGLPSSIVSWFWGLFLLGSILLTHVHEFNEFLPYFSLGKLPERLNLLNTISLNDLMLGLTVCLGLIVSSIPKFRGLTRVSILLIMGYFMPLLWAFALYFIGNHSINGWKHLKAGLKLSHQKMWLYSLPFSLGAYALLAAFISLAPTTDVTAYWTQFFVFISCVSFPHVREMSRFYLESK